MGLLNKFIFNKDIDKNPFINTVVDEWHRLGSHVVSANTIDTFRKGLMLVSFWYLYTEGNT